MTTFLKNSCRRTVLINLEIQQRSFIYPGKERIYQLKSRENQKQENPRARSAVYPCIDYCTEFLQKKLIVDLFL